MTEVKLSPDDWAFVLRTIDAQRERYADCGYPHLADELTIIHESISQQNQGQKSQKKSHSALGAESVTASMISRTKQTLAARCVYGATKNYLVAPFLRY